jgi:spore coat protein CotF
MEINKSNIFDLHVKKHWSLAFPLVQQIMNTIVKEGTGVSPARAR